MNKLLALLFSIVINMTAFNATAQSFNFAIVSPTVNQLSGSTLDIIVRHYNSTFELAFITAVTEDRTDTLSLAGSNGAYADFIGTIDLSGLNQGDTVNLKITCRDVMGNQQSDSVNYIYAIQPYCEILLPTALSSVTSSLRIKTRHTGAEPIIIVEVTLGTEILFSDTSFGIDIDTTIQLNSAWNGNASVHLSVQDRWNRFFNTATNFTIDSYLNYLYMTPVYSGSGKVLDYNYNKILEARSDAVYVIDSGFQSESAIPGTYAIPLTGKLTELGAVWSGFEWTNGVLYNNAYSSAGGKYATYSAYWSDLAVGSGYDLFRRDMETRNDVLVARTFDNRLTSSTVYADGTVLYYFFINEVLMKYKNGATETIEATGAPFGIGGELLFGDTLLYTKTNFEEPSAIVYMHDGTTTTVLSTIASNYKVAGKYLAYAKPGTSGQAQIWIQESSGNSIQKTFFGSGSNIVGLNANGDLLFTNSNKLYHQKKDSINAREIGPLVGWPFFKDTAWYVIKNNALYKININAYRTAAAGNWNDPASWQYGVVPVPNADVIVDTAIIIDSDITCNTLKVIPPGSITVLPGVNLVVLH